MKIIQEATVRTEAGPNFSAVYTGPFARLDAYKLEVPALNRTVKGKLFVKDFLAMTGMQISLNKLPAGAAVPFFHKHKQNEECYIFVSGHGQMQIDGEIFDVEEGTIVRIATGGSRTLRNNSSEDLHYICVQAKENSLQQETFEDGERDGATPTWTD